MAIVRAYLALGTNLGSRAEQLATLASAARNLGQTSGIRVVLFSSVYESAPWGITDQPDFLNAVIGVDTELSPTDLLTRMKQIETDLGRTPGIRWGPRVIDIDLVLYDRLEIDETGLHVPHPRLLGRNFVVFPLLEIDPEAELPSGEKLCNACRCECREPRLIALGPFPRG